MILIKHRSYYKLGKWVIWKIKKKSCQVQGFSGISVFFEMWTQTIENIRFSMMRFLHLYVINHKKDRLIKKESEVIKWLLLKIY